jgi:hypothetical protein
MMADAQSKIMRAENEKQKLAQDAKRLEMDAQYKQAEQFMKAEITRLEMEVVQHKSEVEVGGKLAGAESAQRAQAAQHSIDMLKLRLDEVTANRDRELEYFKAILSAKTDMETAKQADLTSESVSA